jgi:subtilase family serine protease
MSRALARLQTVARVGRPAISRRIGPGPASRVCPNVGAGYMRCMSWIRNDIESPNVISGYAPADLQAAYTLTGSASTRGAGQEIAIVDAFNNPNAEADLAVYRTQFALPPCTTANGCFLKVNQTGVPGSYPTDDAGWALEMSLDVDMASAICPRCDILLVEATDNSDANLYAAEDTAATLCGASVISNSWSGPEYSSEANDDTAHFKHAGIPMTFASGDGDYPGGYPAAGKFVTAVGGTTLTNAGLPGQTETVWNNGPSRGTGSLCSFYEGQPAWQTAVLSAGQITTCSTRVNNDVSAVADPSTGVAIYDTYMHGGWLVIGGTSASTPIIAGVYALAENGGSINDASYIYTHHTGNTNDITSGNDGPCTPTGIYAADYTGTFICDAGAGFDAPSGWGTPNGIGAF